MVAGGAASPGKLSHWSDDVVATVKDVLAGDAAAQVNLATIWSHALYRQRLDLLPQLPRRGRPIRDVLSRAE
jgi:hypothetical protein